MKLEEDGSFSLSILLYMIIGPDGFKALNVEVRGFADDAGFR
jgi:hypothetical protein